MNTSVALLMSESGFIGRMKKQLATDSKRFSCNEHCDVFAVIFPFFLFAGEKETIKQSVVRLKNAFITPGIFQGNNLIISNTFLVIHCYQIRSEIKNNEKS